MFNNFENRKKKHPFDTKVHSAVGDFVFFAAASFTLEIDEQNYVYREIRIHTFI